MERKDIEWNRCDVIWIAITIPLDSTRPLHQKGVGSGARQWQLEPTIADFKNLADTQRRTPERLNFLWQSGNMTDTTGYITGFIDELDILGHDVQRAVCIVLFDKKKGNLEEDLVSYHQKLLRLEDPNLDENNLEEINQLKMRIELVGHVIQSYKEGLNTFRALE